MGATITPNLLELLGVRPVLGAALLAGDEEVETVFISERFWRRNFGADPNIIGRTVRVNESARVIAAVLPSNFELPHPSTDLWKPVGFSRWNDHNFGSYSPMVLARLKRGVTQAAAQNEMDLIAKRIAAEHREKAGLGIKLERMDQFISELTRRPLLLLIGAVAMVLLICCVNVANLLLSRAAARRKEIAIRGALGLRASRSSANC